MVLRSLILLLMLAAACGRPLTDRERAFAGQIQGESLNMDRVRLVDGAPVPAVTFRRQARPRTSCREKILPPVKAEVVTVTPAAVTLFNSIYFSRGWFLDDYVPEYPGKLHLDEAMLLAHELTHVWQWQNRRATGYSPLRAAAEHSQSPDPYLFELDSAADFLAFGYEQQGAIVEEYVCCRALAPAAPRTKRLHAMISGAMPLAELPQSRESDVYLPWKGVELQGICS